jgi:hypothetical protein
MDVRTTILFIVTIFILMVLSLMVIFQVGGC